MVQKQPAYSSVSMKKVLCLGRSFTGRYLKQEFPVEVRFLGRQEVPLEPGWLPDLIVDTIPAIREDSDLLNPFYSEEILRLDELHGRRETKQEGGAFPAVLPYIHVSSTSVYPASSEGLLTVDELSETGESASCRKRLELEEAILKFRPEAAIVRAGGLYGPGRSLPIMIARGKTRFFERGNDIISRIHVHDLCRLILALGEHLIQGSAYFPGYQRTRLINAVDPHPSSVADTRDFLLEMYSEREMQESLARLGLSVPGSLPEPDPVSGQREVRSLYTSDLIGAFRFPDYRSGFRDSISRSMSP
ncbi:MAG: hypothetical protein KDK25_04380 [Leptospiraceae bacterium]|nr:hypothetical protein [Leptospiraceae bacterium]